MYERKLSIGGGMMFNEIVVQKSAVHILNEFGIRHYEYQENYYTADAVEAVCAMAARAVQAGLTIFNCISVEDVMMREEKIIGLVLNWSPVEMAGLHVDPLTMRASFVIDASGHDIEVLRVVEK